jgi:DNA-binding IclR family transcriptional regulator
MSESEWVALMRRYAQAGYAYDLGEDAGAIRCVAAPIRDASTGIVAAISVSSAVEYMGDERMKTLIPVVKRIAQDISADLGARKPAP